MFKKKSLDDKKILVLVRLVRASTKFLVFLVLFGQIWSLVPWSTLHVKAETTIDQVEINGGDFSLPDYPTTTDPDFKPSLVEIDSEVTDKRTATSKTFRKVDGTYEVAMYNDNVHYYKDNAWKQIDNSLIDNGVELETKDNSFKLKFPKSLDDNKQIKLNMDDYAIDWKVLNIESSKIAYENQTFTPNNIKDLVNINQMITYPNINANVDLEYIVSGSVIKENVILTEYIDDFHVTFEYKLKNLSLNTNSDGQIVFINENNEEIFSFNDLIMSDNDLNESTDISFQLVETGNKTYQITLTPSSEWLSLAAYPVKVDPSLRYYGDSNIINDKYVYGNASSTTSASYNKVGLLNSYHYRSYLDFDLTQIPDDIMVNYAFLNIKTYPNYNMCTSGCTILAKEVFTNYELLTITREGMNITEPRIIDYAEVLYSDGSTKTYQWDITRNLQKWLFSGYTSRIIELRKENETSTGYIYLQSENYNIFTGPVLEIGYEATDGLHDYWTYNSQPISTAGTGYISDYTGNLSLIRNDINFKTEKQNLSLSMIYNINDRLENIGYGAGWRTNYNLEARLDTTNNQYYSIDATGAKTYYVSTVCDSRFHDDMDDYYSCYLAEDGSRNLFVTLTDIWTDVTWSFSIVTLEQVYYQFDSDGYLTSLYDQKTSTTTNIAYSVVGNKILINTVTDHTGNYISFEYDSNNNLQYTHLYVKTSDSSHPYDELEKLEYSYTDIGSSIYGLTNAKFYSDYIDDESFTLNSQATYTYDTSKRMASAQSSLGPKVEYSYYYANKVSNVTSYIDSSKIGDVSYSYDFKKTTITNYNDDHLVYWFDNYGHTIQIMSNDGFVQTFKYLNIFSISGEYDTYININGTRNYRQNNLKIYESTPEYAYFNPVINGGFENYQDSLDDPNWDFVVDDYNGYSSSYVGNDYNSDVSVYGQFSAYSYMFFGIDIHYEQDIMLNSGSYTVSGYVKSEGSGAASITVSGASYDSNDVEYIGQDDGWHYVSLTFSVAADDTVVTIKLNKVDGGSGGSVYFDSIQVLEGFRDTRTNLMENPSFEDALSGWTLSGASRAKYTEYVIQDYSDILGDHGIHIYGDEDAVRYARFDITDLLDVSSNNVYSIKLWSRSYGTPIKVSTSINERMYRLRIECVDNEGTYNMYVNFDPSLEEWQRLSKELILDSTTSSVKMYLEYRGLGDVYFDGITIESGISGEYIEVSPGGNITKVINNDCSETGLQYLADNEGQTTERPVDSRAISITSTNDTEIEIPLDFRGRPEYIEKDNVRSTPTYNTNSQVTQLKYGDSTNFFTTSTTYSSGKFNQYTESTTDEFGKSASYDYDLITGLLQSITNANSTTVEYEYYDDGLLHKVINNGYFDRDNASECAVTEYVYDEDNMLIRIILSDDYYYEITYDSLNRMEGISIINDSNTYNNPLMTYTYVVEGTIYTSKLDRQTYGNLDYIQFVYDENDKIIAVQYNDSTGFAKTRFSYEYDQLGRVAVFNTHESINETIVHTEYYTYDVSGNLISISDNNGNRIQYAYDQSGDLTNLDFDINNKTQETAYFYNKYLDYDGTEDDLQSSLYDKTTYTSQDSQGVSKEYFYENNALYKLKYIKVMNGTFTITNDFSFDGDTTRITEITYNIDKTSDGSSTDDIIVSYAYTYDNIGNITSIMYSENSVIQIEMHYEYDAMNQLIVEDVRDTQYLVSNLQDTNYTKYFYYDLRGNITDIKTFLYGQNDITTPIIPSFYHVSSGTYNVAMYYNGYQWYQNIYELELGESPTLDFWYHDLDNQIYPLPLTTTMTFSNLNINSEGYYYQNYTGAGDPYWHVDFRIVFKVGNPTGEATTPQEHIHYNYNSSWKDQLTSYGEIDYINGDPQTEVGIQEYTYDAQGNPTVITNFYYEDNYYDSAALEYDGRQLTKITLTDATLPTIVIEYTYNDQGYRTSKTISGVTTNYFLQGDKVLYETNGTYGIIYTYDFDGTLISFNYDSNTNDPTPGIEYYYLRNQQGDITQIVDRYGNIVVNYQYDAWGNIIKTVGSLKDTIGKINPYRYRGYRFDEEINLYYLNSRYYDANIGRFISSDGMLGQQGDILSTNMYAYCANNPVMHADPSGTTPQIVIYLLKLAAGCAVADGPIPVGDAIALLLLATAAVIAIAAITETNYSKKNKNNYYAYTLSDGEGVFYVGITKNLERRKAQHEATFGPGFVMLNKGPMNLAQARVMETSLIVSYGTRELYKQGQTLLGGTKIMGNQMLSISNRRYPTSLLVHKLESDTLLWIEELGPRR